MMLSAKSVGGGIENSEIIVYVSGGYFGEWQVEIYSTVWCITLVILMDSRVQNLNIGVRSEEWELKREKWGGKVRTCWGRGGEGGLFKSWGFVKQDLWLKPEK